MSRDDRLSCTGTSRSIRKTAKSGVWPFILSDQHKSAVSLSNSGDLHGDPYSQERLDADRRARRMASRFAVVRACHHRDEETADRRSDELALPGRHSRLRAGSSIRSPQPSDVLPSTAERQRFWGQCQHFSWFFLSWHRMYLFYFEQIVSATIEQLNGPDVGPAVLELQRQQPIPTPDASRRRFAPSSRPNRSPIPCSSPSAIPAATAASSSPTSSTSTSASVSPSLRLSHKERAVIPDSADRKPVSITAAAMPSARLK